MKMNMQYHGMTFGVEKFDGRNHLVAYLLPLGSGFVIVPDIDVSRMQEATIPGSRRVRRAIERFEATYPGGID